MEDCINKLSESSFFDFKKFLIVVLDNLFIFKYINYINKSFFLDYHELLSVLGLKSLASGNFRSSLHLLGIFSIYLIES